MKKFSIKLRNDKKKLNVFELNSKSLKIKFKIKGLHMRKKFSAFASFAITLNSNNIKVSNLSIYDIELKSSLKSSSNSCSNSCSMFMNPYTLNSSSSSDSSSSKSCHENLLKSLYTQLKKFINAIKISISNNFIETITFNTTHSEIKKMNIKGYLRQYK